jgi:hypothetical protein
MWTKDTNLGSIITEDGQALENVAAPINSTRFAFYQFKVIVDSCKL